MHKKKMCVTCGDVGDCDGMIGKCVNCYEIEKRLEAYLRSPKGVDFVEAALRRRTDAGAPVSTVHREAE